MKHSPGGWADIARAFEDEGKWYEAAKAWEGAKGATIGHKRRDRYERQRDRCITNGDEAWAKFSKGKPKHG